jgi:hypothetical protein
LKSGRHSPALMAGWPNNTYCIAMNSLHELLKRFVALLPLAVSPPGPTREEKRSQPGCASGPAFRVREACVRGPPEAEKEHERASELLQRPLRGCAAKAPRAKQASIDRRLICRSLSPVTQQHPT